jgi:formylglycine-generating enzyme
MSNCGSGGDGRGTESCCTSLELAAGTYYRTYTNSGSGPTGEADPATVSGFRLDKYLVTVGRFRQFVNAWANGYLPAGGSGKHTYLNGGLGLVDVGAPADVGSVHETGWQTSDDGNIAPTSANLSCAPASSATFVTPTTWTPSAGGKENLPIDCVTWQEAYAFCIWDGGFLPTEAEWEYAAAGGSLQRGYPWGSADPGAGNDYAIYDCNYPPSGAGACDTAPVGTATLGAGFWGQLDLSGEVFEWTIDWYADYVDPCANCAFLAVRSNRADRGDSFGFGGNDSFLPPSKRHHDAPTARFSYVGFRCARAP